MSQGVGMKVMKEQNIDVLKWALQSPDLNSIKNLRFTLRSRVSARHPVNADGLWFKLKEYRAKVSRDECRNLIQTCSRRSAAVILELQDCSPDMKEISFNFFITAFSLFLYFV